MAKNLQIIELEEYKKDLHDATKTIESFSNILEDDRQIFKNKQSLDSTTTILARILTKKTLTLEEQNLLDFYLRTIIFEKENIIRKQHKELLVLCIYKIINRYNNNPTIANGGIDVFSNFIQTFNLIFTTQKDLIIAVAELLKQKQLLEYENSDDQTDLKKVIKKIDATNLSSKEIDIITDLNRQSYTKGIDKLLPVESWDNIMGSVLRETYPLQLEGDEPSFSKKNINYPKISILDLALKNQNPIFVAEIIYLQPSSNENIPLTEYSEILTKHFGIALIGLINSYFNHPEYVTYKAIDLIITRVSNKFKINKDDFIKNFRNEGSYFLLERLYQISEKVLNADNGALLYQKYRSLVGNLLLITDRNYILNIMLNPNHKSHKQVSEFYKMILALDYKLTDYFSISKEITDDLSRGKNTDPKTISLDSLYTIFDKIKNAKIHKKQDLISLLTIASYIFIKNIYKHVDFDYEVFYRLQTLLISVTKDRLKNESVSSEYQEIKLEEIFYCPIESNYSMLKPYFDDTVDFDSLFRDDIFANKNIIKDNKISILGFAIISLNSVLTDFIIQSSDIEEALKNERIYSPLSTLLLINVNNESFHKKDYLQFENLTLILANSEAILEHGRWPKIPETYFKLKQKYCDYNKKQNDYDHVLWKERGNFRFDLFTSLIEYGANNFRWYYENSESRVKLLESNFCKKIFLPLISKHFQFYQDKGISIHSIVTKVSPILSIIAYNYFNNHQKSKYFCFSIISSFPPKYNSYIQQAFQIAGVTTQEVKNIIDQEPILEKRILDKGTNESITMLPSLEESKISLFKNKTAAHTEATSQNIPVAKPNKVFKTPGSMFQKSKELQDFSTQAYDQEINLFLEIKEIHEVLKLLAYNSGSLRDKTDLKLLTANEINFTNIFESAYNVISSMLPGHVLTSVFQSQTTIPMFDEDEDYNKKSDSMQRLFKSIFKHLSGDLSEVTPSREYSQYSKLAPEERSKDEFLLEFIPKIVKYYRDQDLVSMGFYEGKISHSKDPKNEIIDALSLIYPGEYKELLEQSYALGRTLFDSIKYISTEILYLYYIPENLLTNIIPLILDGLILTESLIKSNISNYRPQEEINPNLVNIDTLIYLKEILKDKKIEAIKLFSFDTYNEKKELIVQPITAMVITSIILSWTCKHPKIAISEIIPISHRDFIAKERKIKTLATTSLPTPPPQKAISKEELQILKSIALALTELPTLSKEQITFFKSLNIRGLVEIYYKKLADLQNKFKAERVAEVSNSIKEEQIKLSQQDIQKAIKQEVSIKAYNKENEYFVSKNTVNIDYILEYLLWEFSEINSLVKIFKNPGITKELAREKDDFYNYISIFLGQFLTDESIKILSNTQSKLGKEDIKIYLSQMVHYLSSYNSNDIVIHPLRAYQKYSTANDRQKTLSNFLIEFLPEIMIRFDRHKKTGKNFNIEDIIKKNFSSNEEKISIEINTLAKDIYAGLQYISQEVSSISYFNENFIQNIIPLIVDGLFLVNNLDKFFSDGDYHTYGDIDSKLFNRQIKENIIFKIISKNEATRFSSNSKASFATMITIALIASSFCKQKKIPFSSETIKDLLSLLPNLEEEKLGIFKKEIATKDALEINQQVSKKYKIIQTSGLFLGKKQFKISEKFKDQELTFPKEVKQLNKLLKIFMTPAEKESNLGLRRGSNGFYQVIYKFISASLNNDIIKTLYDSKESENKESDEVMQKKTKILVQQIVGALFLEGNPIKPSRKYKKFSVTDDNEKNINQLITEFIPVIVKNIINSQKERNLVFASSHTDIDPLVFTKKLLEEDRFSNNFSFPEDKNRNFIYQNTLKELVMVSKTIYKSIIYISKEVLGFPYINDIFIENILGLILDGLIHNKNAMNSISPDFATYEGLNSELFSTIVFKKLKVKGAGVEDFYFSTKDGIIPIATMAMISIIISGACKHNKILLSKVINLPKQEYLQLEQQQSQPEQLKRLIQEKERDSFLYAPSSSNEENFSNTSTSINANNDNCGSYLQNETNFSITIGHILDEEINLAQGVDCQTTSYSNILESKRKLFSFSK